ncbi:MAG: hypothetical protein M1829_004731 [Trizodia sp. TS-e1964]|nr:MAG: hypothetical protein M1829_004731 [Trizodia sp. TS-e1964]
MYYYIFMFITYILPGFLFLVYIPKVVHYLRSLYRISQNLRRLQNEANIRGLGRFVQTTTWWICQLSRLLFQAPGEVLDDTWRNFLFLRDRARAGRALGLLFHFLVVLGLNIILIRAVLDIASMRRNYLNGGPPRVIDYTKGLAATAYDFFILGKVA